jgi:hypothetical protein
MQRYKTESDLQTILESFSGRIPGLLELMVDRFVDKTKSFYLPDHTRFLAALSQPISRLKGEQQENLLNQIYTKLEEVTSGEKWGNSLKGQFFTFLGVAHLPQNERRQALLSKVTPTKFDELKGKKSA